MFRKALALTAAVICMGAGPGDDLVADLLSGRIDPLSYDYGALRDRPDADAFLEQAEARAKREVLRRHGVPDDVPPEKALYADCASAAEIAVQKGLSSARKAASRVDWLSAKREAVDAEARRQALRRAIFAGETVPYDQLRGVERSVRLSREAKDPVVAELFRRHAEEQFSRLGIGFSARHFFAEGVSEAGLDLYDAAVVRETCLVDADNRAWLKATLARRGWFRISVDGERADSAAWTLAQHADRDVAFQQAVLVILEKELAAKETSSTNYAYLWDRVAVNTGKPQRYATQGSCKGPGDWRPDPLEDSASVERWRTEFGIDWPMEEYIAKMNTFCR